MVVFVLWAGSLLAQSPWNTSSKPNRWKHLSVEAGVGGRMYFGEIQKKGSLFNPIKLTYGAGVRYQFTPRLGAALQVEGRGYKGKAVHGGHPDALDEMNGQLWGGHIMGQFSILRWEDFTRRQFTERDPVTKINTFVGAGFGMAQFSASYTSRTYQVITQRDSLGNDTATFSFPVDASGSAAGMAPYVPVVFGFRYRFKPVFSLGFEYQRHIYIAKNVDALATKKFDNMGTLTVRASYTFGQGKKIGNARRITRKGRYK